MQDINGGSPTHPEVVLICPPWLEPRQAPLGVGIVAALLRRAKISTTLLFPNIGFYLRIADKFGRRIADFAFLHSEVGEVLTGTSLSPSTRDPVTAPVLTFLREHSYPESLFECLAQEWNEFSRECLCSLDWRSVSVCGFTLGIRQTTSALDWAQRISTLAPHVSLVFGGSQCSDPMGLELLRSFSFLDCVVRGEADASIVPLFECLLDRGTQAIQRIPNIVYRDDSGLHITTTQVPSINDTVSPDYSDFHINYRPVRDLTGIPANYYIEASRGCWWGQKQHCTFCGIHTSSIAFRSKDAERVYSEIEQLLRSYDIFRFVFADTTLSVRHITELMPRLERLAERYDFEFGLDIKSNLKKEQVYQLAQAGCYTLQTGVESFSDRMLTKLKKGCTVLGQIQTLKWCAEAGIFPYYHILTHIPGETARDYEEMLSLIQCLKHIPPPSGVFPIELNRYAPYFEQWEEYGFTRPTPARMYKLMFPGAELNLERFAYKFEGFHPTTNGASVKAAREKLQRYVDDEWKAEYTRRSMYYRIGVNCVLITCSGKDRLLLSLPGVEGDIYLRCDRVTSRDQLEKQFRGRISHSELDSLLRGLVSQGVMLASADGGPYLSLALRRISLRSALSTSGSRRDSDHAARLSQTIGDR